MADLPGWPNAELLAREVLADLTVQEVVAVLPPDLEERLPLQRVTRIGGSDDRITDTARIAVETYAATAAEAETLAEQTRQRFQQRRVRVPSGLMDRAETEVGPQPADYPNQAVRMVTAIYRVSARRRFT